MVIIQKVKFFAGIIFLNCHFKCQAMLLNKFSKQIVEQKIIENIFELFFSQLCQTENNN